MPEREQELQARVDEWQPIETAPHNKIILTFAIVDNETRNWNIRTSHWRLLEIDHSHWAGWGYGHEPTHWMPLPKPPLAAAPNKKGEGK